MTDKKYNIIHTIQSDGPYGHVNWINISFLTPQKIEKTKHLDVIGLKIHNGYASEELATSDAKVIRSKNKNHDTYTIEMGKLYPWDDVTLSDAIEYGDSKLNELEKNRRENADKLNLMREQFKNEYSNFPINSNNDRKRKQFNRIRQKLYKEGKITKTEYELMQDKNKPLNEIKAEAEIKEKMIVEIDEAWKTDHLDENESVALKYGCGSIFTPKRVGNLKQICFKIRGLFETIDELTNRVAELKKKYPNDPIQTFELGKWCVDSDSKTMTDETKLKQLNYAMKYHIEHLSTEEEEFLKRKKTMKEDAENHAKLTAINNKKAQRKANRDARSGKKNNTDSTTDTAQTDLKPKSQPKPKPKSQSQSSEIHSLGNGTDDKPIRQLMNFLNDDELRGKYETEIQDKSNATVVEI